MTASRRKGSPPGASWLQSALAIQTDSASLAAVELTSARLSARSAPCFFSNHHNAVSARLRIISD